MVSPGHRGHREGGVEVGADVLHHAAAGGYLPQDLVALRRDLVDLQEGGTDLMRVGLRSKRDKTHDQSAKQTQDHGRAYSCRTVSGTPSASKRTS